MFDRRDASGGAGPSRPKLALQGLLAVAFALSWAYIFGTTLVDQLRSGNELLTVYAALWLVTPVVVGAWHLARSVGYAERPLRVLGTATGVVLAGGFWFAVWGKRLVDGVGSLPPELLRGTVLLAPLLLAVLYLLGDRATRTLSGP